MPSYRVCHSDSGATFFLVAENPKDAVEIVTMRVGSASGKTAWEAKPQPAPVRAAQGAGL